MERGSPWWLAAIPLGWIGAWVIAYGLAPSLDKQVLYAGVLLDAAGLATVGLSLIRLRSIFAPPRPLEGLDAEEQTREEFYRERRRQRRAEGARDSAIRELAMGGFYVEMMSLAWIFVGVIFSAIPEEIAALLRWVGVGLG